MRLSDGVSKDKYTSLINKGKSLRVYGQDILDYTQEELFAVIGLMEEEYSSRQKMNDRDVSFSQLLNKKHV